MTDLYKVYIISLMRTQLINFVIPEGLLRQIDQLAKKQYRSRSEALREAARQLIEEAYQKERDFELIAESAGKVNLTEDKAFILVEQVRAKLSLNK